MDPSSTPLPHAIVIVKSGSIPLSPPGPIQIPSLVEIVLAELNRHKSKITHLNDCSVSDAAPVLIKLGFAQLLAIEANTVRD
jgi:hypothetical protein